MGRPYLPVYIYNELPKVGKDILQPARELEGVCSIKKIDPTCESPEDVASNLLRKQALWQIYLQAPRPKFNVPVRNEVHQADLLFLLHDRSRKTFKYALTVVDLATRFKEAQPLAMKEAREVATALERIYHWSPLCWPKLLKVDPAHEVMGTVNQLLVTHDVKVRRGRLDIHRD